MQMYSVGGAALTHGYVPKPLRGGSVHPDEAVTFCRVGQNALAMQTHQPQVVDNHGGSARLTPLEPPYVLKSHSLEEIFRSEP